MQDGPCVSAQEYKQTLHEQKPHPYETKTSLLKDKSKTHKNLHLSVYISVCLYCFQSNNIQASLEPVESSDKW